MRLVTNVCSSLAGPSDLTIEFAQIAADTPTPSLVFYVPTGIAPTLSAAAGTTIGAASASVSAADLGNAVVPPGR